MATTVMRNVVTGEYKTVEADSEEFWTLRAELQVGNNRPRWEQTGHHDLQARQAREDAGVIYDTDMGENAGPILVSSTPTAEAMPQLDRGWPTPGEIEQGAGRAAEFDEETLEHMGGTGEKVVESSTGGGGINQGYPAGVAPTPLSDDQAQRVEDSLGDYAGTAVPGVEPDEVRVSDSLASALGEGTAQRDNAGQDPSVVPPVTGGDEQSAISTVLQEDANSGGDEEDDSEPWNLQGQALAKALEDRGLDKSGTADDKRARLKEDMEKETT
jgi:hypothetical protein